MDSTDKDKVGYGKPPKASQFKKGQSGNPKGRPKGNPDFSTSLQKALRETVVINEKGRRKTISKLEAVLKQLANKVASGDLRALRQLAALLRALEKHPGKPTAPRPWPTPAEIEAVKQKLMG